MGAGTDPDLLTSAALGHKKELAPITSRWGLVEMVLFYAKKLRRFTRNNPFCANGLK